MRAFRALVFLAALDLGLLVVVQSCGHHLVHGDMKDLAARHLQQQAHLRATARLGLRLARGFASGGKVLSAEQRAELRWVTQLELVGHDPYGQGHSNHGLGPGQAQTLEHDHVVEDLGRDHHFNRHDDHKHRHEHDGGEGGDAHGLARQEEGEERWRGVSGDVDGAASPRRQGGASAGEGMERVASAVDEAGREEEAVAAVEEEEGAGGGGGGWERFRWEEVDAAAEAAGEDQSRGAESRRLQEAHVPPPAPIRLSITYQRISALTAAQQRTLTRVVEAVRRILQKFINVKQPSVGGMLADPYVDYVTGAIYPDFFTNSRNPRRDCGLATILPEHVVDKNACAYGYTMATVAGIGRNASGPMSGAGGGRSAYGTGCPSYTKSKGEDVDMYLYITAVQNDDCAAGAAAFARPCLLDLGNNRPLLGNANVCPRALGLLDEEALTAVLTHEMIHALGFTDAMYNLTRRPDRTPRPAAELVASATVGGRSVQLLTSPNVRDAARAHFGCPSLAGAQLEEEGSTGSAGSHWEYTHFQGEVMVASTVFSADGSPPALSNLTLAYLDDTGWYVTNRSAAGLLAWGSGAGCSLPTRTCRDYMAEVPGQRLFCDPPVPGALGSAGSSSITFRCSNDYKATGVCRALNFTGGCGLTVSRNTEQTCLGPNAANAEPDVFGWGTGSPSGRCLPVVNRFQAYVGNNFYTYPSPALGGREGDADAACFDTGCLGGKVYVKLLGQAFECPAGEYLDLAKLLRSRYKSGRIGPCPPAWALCATQTCPASQCSTTGGDCYNGACYCRLPYTGPGCRLNLITGQAVVDVGDDGSDGGGGGGGSAAATPPPPLRLWVQVVQLSLALNNSVSYVNGRLPQLRGAIASWAGLNVTAVTINNVAPADGSGAVLNGTGTVAGDAYDATATDGGRRRRRGLQQAAAASPPPASPPPPAAVGSVATSFLTPRGSGQAATLLTWLKSNETQRSALTAALAAAGFSLMPNGISAQSVITLSTDQSTGSPAAATTTTSGPADSGSDRGRIVMIIALVVTGVAVVGIIAALVTVLVQRARRKRRWDAGRTSAYQVPPAAAMALAATPSTAAAAAAAAGFGPSPAAAGGGGGGGGGGGFGPTPSTNPFAGAGAGPWSGAGYGGSGGGGGGYGYGGHGTAPPYPYQPGGPGQLPPLYSGVRDGEY